MSTRQLSRREVLTTVGGAGAAGLAGVAGLSAITSTAAAQAGLSFEDTTTTLAPGEMLGTLAASGTVEGSYEAPDTEIAGASFDVTLALLDGGNVVEESTSNTTYDDVDPNSDTISDDVDFSVPHWVEGNPDPGTSTEYTFRATAVFRVADGSGELVTEASATDTATLTIERAGNSDGGGGGGGSTQPASASVGGSVAFEIETA